MLPDRCPTKSTLHKVAAMTAALLFGVLPGLPLQAQTTPPVLGQCVPAPDPAAPDHWPHAGTDALGSTIGPRTFSGATLLANDSGTSVLTIRRVGPMSAAGGTITGSDPYTYTPPPSYSGNDSFSYVIADLGGEATMGIIRISVALDTAAPAISLASPGVTVSGNVPLTATATDNVGVAGVTFFDG